MLEHVGRRPRRSRWWPGRARWPHRHPAGSPAASMPSTSASSAASFESRSGAKPPSSPTAVDRPRSCRVRLSAWKTSTPVRRPAANESRPHGHDHELLEVDLVVRVGAAVQHVHHRHGQHVRGLAAEIAPQRQPGLGGGGLGGGERHAEDRVGPQSPLVRRAVAGRSWRGRAPPGRAASIPRTRVGQLAVDVAHRLATRPCPPRRPRRRAAPPPRTRRWRPPRAPRRAPRRRSASTTSTSTVGLPRLSRICRPCTVSISLTAAPSDRSPDLVRGCSQRQLRIDAAGARRGHHVPEQLPSCAKH